ncbi:MAG: hypothetical protein GX614_11745 [Sandaracinaceae bacterium]|nr:hypothetical protein [Sandaracinaceae bacterium]
MAKPEDLGELGIASLKDIDGVRSEDLIDPARRSDDDAPVGAPELGVISKAFMAFFQDLTGELAGIAFAERWHVFERALERTEPIRKIPPIKGEARTETIEAAIVGSRVQVSFRFLEAHLADEPCDRIPSGLLSLGALEGDRAA